MSIRHVCDGCKKDIEKPVNAGAVLVRDYCPECVKIAEDYLKEDNALRLSLIQAYNKKRLALIKKFTGKNNFILPDVVYDNTGPNKS